MITPILKRAAGLDVHKKSVMATIQVEDEDGVISEQTKEFGTFAKDRRKLRAWLLRSKVEIVVMESTGIYWKRIYSALEDSGINIQVVNAQHVKKVPGRKTDVQDSQWLASLARFGLLKSSFIPPKDLRELRLITRYRIKVKGMLASEKNRLHKILEDSGICLGSVVSDINGASAKDIIAGLIDGKPVKELIPCVRGRLKAKIPSIIDALEDDLGKRHSLVLRIIKQHIRHLEDTIREIDTYLIKAMEPYREEWQILQTIPGVDAISAIILLVEIGTDMERFGSISRFCSWTGMCPGNNESAGKKKSGRIRKGNRIIRQLLCEVANAASKTDSQFKSKYTGLVIRRGHKRAIVAIGHKILRVVYALFKSKKPYHEPGIDYEALMVMKNAPRWITALKKFGYWPEDYKAAA